MNTKNLWVAVLGSVALGSMALASGGPLDERTVECRGAKGAKGAVPLVVFRLHTAPSSETRGDALVYDDEKAKNKMKTSMADCFELSNASAEPAPAGAGESALVCGNPEHAQAREQVRGGVRVRPNKAGFRVILDGTKARVEKVDAAGAPSSVYGELSCTEKT